MELLSDELKKAAQMFSIDPPPTIAFYSHIYLSSSLGGSSLYLRDKVWRRFPWVCDFWVEFKSAKWTHPLECSELTSELDIIIRYRSKGEEFTAAQAAGAAAAGTATASIKPRFGAGSRATNAQQPSHSDAWVIQSTGRVQLLAASKYDDCRAASAPKFDSTLQTTPQPPSVNTDGILMNLVLYDLPADMILEVVNFLKLPDPISLLLTCSSLYSLSNERSF
ncbi:hypothetical protein B0H19DRAFT_1224840 [Mycena capillaripes]|nr:hypothetical protein B0H19DRAFT_1224840 [Mycena capillaripes]